MWVPDSQQLTRLLAKLEKGSRRRTNKASLILVVVVAAAEKAAAATSLAVSLPPLSLSLLQCQLAVYVSGGLLLLLVRRRERRPAVVRFVMVLWLPCSRSDSIFPASVVFFGDL